MADLRSPVAMLIFNRPEQTRAVFAQIAQARPTKLLLVADGPRPERSGEAELCAAARAAVLDQIDWPCEVRTNFSPTNLGCRRRISSGLDWVFTQTEEAIILEDDCLPDRSLFRFLDEMLAHYRDDHRIMMISAFNPVPGGWLPEVQEYHYSYCGSIWGWASWRRAWRCYDVRMSLWANGAIQERVKDVFADPELYTARMEAYDRTYRGLIDTWDYQWSFARAIHSGLSIVPSVNLVTNIGFGADATHTRKPHAALMDVPIKSMSFPIRFHPYVAVDRDYDRAFTRLASGKT
jgi:hypothetical protein